MTISKWRITDNPNQFSIDQIIEMTSMLVNKAKESDIQYDIAIGTDSQILKRGYRFVTVLCVYLKGKGGMYYYLSDHKEAGTYSPHNRKMRMFDEVATSIEVANYLFDKTGLTAEIHIDASPEDKKEFTSSIAEQLRGYATACGFEAKIKPDSWAAYALSDKHSKARIDKKRRKHFKAR